MTLTKEHAITALKQVVDPEIQIDIYTLGLIYDIHIDDKDHVVVHMTLTSPLCPFGPLLLEEARDELLSAGFKDPQIDIVFDPPWQPSEDVKMMLGLM